MKKLLLFLFTFGLLISNSVTAEIVLYCNAELATGFNKKNGIYRTTNFKLERYTVKFSDDYYEVKGLDIVGEKYAWQCNDSFDNKSYNTFVCSSDIYTGATFSYHKETKRFVFFRGGATGFVDNGTDDNFMTAGTCKKF